MELTLRRIAKKPNYTIGKLYIENKYFADTIEDTDRGLRLDMPLEEIKKKKVYGKTAIPTGTYEVTLNVISPKYSRSAFMRLYANGAKVPRLLNVKGWEGVLIHTGNYASDSLGCLIVGKNTKVGMVTDSRNTFIKLYKELLKAKDKIFITIQ